MPGVTGYIIIHGTSQDLSSLDENTVKLYKHLKMNGENVVELAGPGSTARSIIRAMRDMRLDASFSTGPDVPMDYFYEMFLGTAIGAGVQDIVKEGIEAINGFSANGIKEIKIIGFSRGAVSAAMLPIEWSKSSKDTNITFQLGLLDPVPGPYPMPPFLIMPPSVKHAVLLVSRDEGRPFFGHLGLTFNLSTSTYIDLMRGVHGDIGGSTRSELSELALDTLVRELELPYPQLSSTERVAIIFRSIVGTEAIARRGAAQLLTARDFGWSEVPTRYSGLIDWPSAQLRSEFLLGMPGANTFFWYLMKRQFDEAMFRQTQQALASQQELQMIAARMANYAAQNAWRQYLQYHVPQRAVRNHVGQVFHPPPAILPIVRQDLLMRLGRFALQHKF